MARIFRVVLNCCCGFWNGERGSLSGWGTKILFRDNYVLFELCGRHFQENNKNVVLLKGVLNVSEKRFIECYRFQKHVHLTFEQLTNVDRTKQIFDLYINKQKHNYCLMSILLRED